jgi:cytochrome c oxidase accessory protein FixG
MLGFHDTRKWVYAQHIDGKYQRLRRWTFLALNLLLFATPWVRIGGSPALRFDLAERRLFAFGAMYTASDTLLLLLLLLFLAFSLFFFTALFGRLWCGYACPQTVFLDAFVRPIERWIEGEWTTRRRRDAGPLTFALAWRKAAKWTLFAAAAFLVSMGFMSFWAGGPELWTGRAGPVEYWLVAISTAVFFADFAWFQEQFCNYLCPYARFQSALTDDQTLLIGYDPRRGEPRGGTDAKEAGRCIECNKCVNVCPQGIDIRNGFQLECIGCAACVDACAGVMARFGHETLVDYGSLASLAGRPARLLRGRTVAYGGLLLALAATAMALLVARVPFEASVSRAPGSLFTMDGDGYVRNTYFLRLANNAARPDSLRFAVSVEGLAGADVTAPQVSLAPRQDELLPLIVRIRASASTPRTLPMRVRVAAPTGQRVLTTTFETGGLDARD